jgi:hypothetical protein
VPVTVENIIKFDITQIPDFSVVAEIFRDVINYGDLCILSNTEKEQVKEFWKELSI